MLPEHCRIGVIEDDPVMGESLLQRLELEGCDVDWWTTGQEAVIRILFKVTSADR